MLSAATAQILKNNNMENIREQNIKPSRLPHLLVAHVLILIGYSFNKGLFFHQSQVWLVFAGWLVLLLALFNLNLIKFKFSFSLLELLLSVSLVNFLFFYIFDSGFFLTTLQDSNNIFLLKFIALGLFSLYFVELKVPGRNFFSMAGDHFARRKFIYLVAIALILRLSMVLYSPTPRIDVFWLLQEGADAMLAGQNPYAGEFSNIYSSQECLAIYSIPECVNDNYSYLPVTIFMTAIFKAIFGDVRFTYIFSSFGVAAIIYSLLRKKYENFRQVPELMSLLFLYIPLSLFILEQTWTDQLVVFFLYLFVFLLLKGYRYWPYAIFGLLLAVKQTAWVFLPFIFKLKDIDFKKIILTLGVVAVIVIPFIIWDYQQFMIDIVADQLQMMDGMHSLSFMTLSKLYFYNGIPIFIILLLLAVLFRALFFKTEKGLNNFIHCSVVLALFLFLIKRGLTNYYYFISAGIILLIVLELRQLNFSSNNNNYPVVDRQSSHE